MTSGTTTGGDAGDTGAVALAVELVDAAVEAVRKAVDLVSPGQVWALSNRDLILALQAREHLVAAAAALEAPLVRECDLRGVAAEHGQPSTAAWLAKLLRLNPGEAKARVKNADILSRRAGETAAALRDGKLNAAQGRAVAMRWGRSRTTRPKKSSPRRKSCCAGKDAR